MVKKTPSKPKPGKQNFLDGEFNLPNLEEKVLAFWGERKIFEKSLEKNKPGARGASKNKEFVFYEGPPYANGKPALHHVLARVVKDVMLRYKTMRGYYVPRRAGWDTHGLPVEMAAEKALGFKSKKDIEKFGVQRFNEEAKKQVWINKDEWERLTNRIGYWLDLKNAYVTYAPEYIETVWWTLAQISKRQLLYKGHKVVPWCTRCGTALSSHELAQGYKEVIDQSVYVKFKLKPGQKIGANFTVDDKTFVLSWTTTPWTLPGNVALAVGEDIEYVIQTNVEGFEENAGKFENFILAKDIFENLYEKDDKNALKISLGLVDARREKLQNPSTSIFIKGKDLEKLEYEPLFEVAPLQSPLSYKIYPADFVTTTDGTGVVHTAVMYGEDDYELGKKIGLPQHHTVNEEGKFTGDVAVLAGEYAKSKETEAHIFDYLAKNGTLLRTENYEHEYPFCWRCGTAILYYARTSWFIAMSKLRKELLKNNETVNWMPEHIKEGRFGEWLREAKDWNLSRERYWGAPLPIWECKQYGHTEVVESLEALSSLAGPAKNRYWAVRHGESENVVFNIIDSGNQNFHLTAKGRKQIEVAAKKIKSEDIDLIFASDLVRTKESAEIIAEVLGVKKVIFDKRLREIDLGSLSGQEDGAYSKRLSSAEDKFSGHAVPGAESLRDVRARAWDFLQDMERTYTQKNILIVSHEDTIWMLAEAAYGWSERTAADKKANNEGIFMTPAEVITLEVRSIPRDEIGNVDLHRPFVDEVVLTCPECRSGMRRVREVADVWYDSGAMPYAQAHYPFSFEKDKKPGEKIQDHGLVSQLEFPADYVAEGMDQLRGWFYTLIAIATALGYGAPYKNVITFGLMNDKFGNKMSKSKGNVIEPFAVIDKYGVDAVRWYFYSGTPFGEPKNFDEADVAKALRKVHLIVYNSFVFWKTYASGKMPASHPSSLTSPHVLDRWILVRLNDLINSVTAKLDAYQVRESTLEIEGFIDDLSRWYIRRSRKRLQRPDSKEDYEAASSTLGFVLSELIKIMAPFTPFFSEVLHSAMGAGGESVHLAAWPTPNDGESMKDMEILKQMESIRKIAAVGLAKRAEAKIKVRQPLRELKMADKGLAGQEGLLQILADEINVKRITFDAGVKDGIELDTIVTPELREEGLLRDLVRMVQELRQKAELAPKDTVVLMVGLPEDIRNAAIKNEKTLKSDVGAKTIEYKKSDKFDAEEEGEIDKQMVWIGLRKIEK